MPAPSTHIPTVSDLRVRKCYICYEEEQHDRPEIPAKEWIHPCNCTLVAHERCLLKWIESAQADPSREANALKCPQCSASYEIESNNPRALRLMNMFNKIFTSLGKKVTVVSIAVVAGAFGTALYILSLSYGAYAVHRLLGKETYDLLLTDDPANWPWNAYVNLPIISTGILLSQTPLQISTFPWLLLTIVGIPIESPALTINSNWLRQSPKLKLSPNPGFTSWPPSPPVFAFLIYPFVRAFYRIYRERFRHWLLSSRPGERPRARRFEWALEFFQLGVEFPDRARQPRGEREVAANQGGEAEDEDEDDDDDDDDEEPGRTMTVSTSSLGRSIASALLVPDIANIMGSLLYRLSKRSSHLKQFLAVRPPLGPAAFSAMARYNTSTNWEHLSPFAKFKAGVSSIWGGGVPWLHSDPVWWRNSIGLGVFVMIKDAVHLLYSYLSKREIDSRRVKNKSFDGIDLDELDLIYPPRRQT